MNAKFPNVRVKLVGTDGNAMAIMGTVSGAMRRGGCTKEEIDKYLEDAMSGDYNNLLQVTTQTVEVM